MTAWPVPENAGCWWLTCGQWRRLHAVPGEAVNAGAMRDAIDWGLPLPARAVCGLRRRWWQLAGLGSRLGVARCGACCQALGIAPGHGTPANSGP